MAIRRAKLVHTIKAHRSNDQMPIIGVVVIVIIVGLFLLISAQ